jgi:alpha-galactosidase
MKITFIGAGSVEFTRKMVSDLVMVPEFQSIEIALMDIDKRNLDLIERVLAVDLKTNGITGVTLTKTTNQRQSVSGAKYIFNVARVGGLEAFEHDIEIPLKYGVDQCVGDTLCVGGIMYGQRTIPMLLSLCKDIREVGCKDALLLNYANPNAMNTWAANTYGKVKTIGLCHGVQHGHEQIAEILGLKQEEVDIICAGINHQTWYIQVLHNGVDMRDKLLDGFKNHPVYSQQEKVRIDILERFGYYSTESNGHLSEYLAWYRKRPEEIDSWIDYSGWIHGETGGYLKYSRELREKFEKTAMTEALLEPYDYKEHPRSSEHGSYIVEALETGRVYRGHFNVMNEGCISNLPDDCVVEVPGYVDRNGIAIPKVGDLPLGCAAICNQSISVQRMAVEAAVQADISLLKQAALLDPLTGAVCNPPEVWQMIDEMLLVEQQWLPQYQKKIGNR